MSEREDDRGSKGEVPEMKDTNTGGVMEGIGGKNNERERERISSEGGKRGERAGRESPQSKSRVS